MSNPHINQVRQALLDTLADLRNKEAPLDIDRAKAVATVASVLVDTAKVENECLKITGQDRSNFIETPEDDMPRITTSASPFPGLSGVIRHRI
jgi:hypothetical protein